jgi:hypothetical protein
MINWVGVIQETLMITSFVIIMMLLIEFINVATHGSLVRLLSKNSYIQIIVGTVLGSIPGCMGPFAVASLYSRKVVSFGALVATMIATSGDEAFFMLAVMPKNAMILFVILAVLAIGVGVLTDKIFKKSFIKDVLPYQRQHHDHDCESTHNTNILSFRNFSFDKYRILMIVFIVAVIVLASIGWIGHSHSGFSIFNMPANENIEEIHVHNEQCDNANEYYSHSDCEHERDSHGHSHGHGEIDIVKIVIVACASIFLIIILFSNKHFIEEHLWGHVLKRHLPKTFLWIFGTLILITLVLNILDLDSWFYKNYYVVLLIAVLIGIIPQSGPHLLFVVLFIQGTIPFSILLANSIVQDGHGALPILAESKKSFIIMKAICIVVGFVVGLVGLLSGF